MHIFRLLWPYARNAWGTTVAVVTILVAIYHGPRALFESYDWYMDRFVDYKVKDFLDAQITKASFTHPSGGRSQTAGTKTVSEIAQATGLSEKRVLGCLGRLKRKKHVAHETGEYWKVEIPPLTSA
ncbi:hypothetical protein AciX8_1769 [Granulicella mallensis MP5ACTX8]|uniref:Uncharacterized protein n=1 Tax=Granulicella mallensis (strain ATCC BAA-1857 / DSM 23137 / MP5ACTX8) TaxID=682795 RepID=G8NQF8_GRAMM|nr:hypothetical protein AciX8_1769 [Granulicella mallensis MP5ACTX8]